MIVDQYEIKEHVRTGGMYDGNTVYKIKLTVDGKEYISSDAYTLKEALKEYEKMRKLDGY